MDKECNGTFVDAAVSCCLSSYDLSLHALTARTPQPLRTGCAQRASPSFLVALLSRTSPIPLSAADKALLQLHW